jgi:hypothetical protein
MRVRGLPAVAGNTATGKVDQTKIQGSVAEYVDELSDEALDRPAGELARACHQTAMTAMVKA